MRVSHTMNSEFIFSNLAVFCKKLFQIVYLASGNENPGLSRGFYTTLRFHHDSENKMTFCDLRTAKYRIVTGSHKRQYNFLFGSELKF